MGMNYILKNISQCSLNNMQCLTSEQCVSFARELTVARKVCVADVLTTHWQVRKLTAHATSLLVSGYSCHIVEE
jgi:hypothetical protein